MFIHLCEYQVPVLRATWFIKLSSAYTVAVSEAKIKKRQLPDPTQGIVYFIELDSPVLNKIWILTNISVLEWTCTLLKFMKEQLVKLQDYYQNNTNQNCNALVPIGGGPSPADEQRLALKQWQYCTQLAKHMYQVKNVIFDIHLLSNYRTSNLKVI